MILNALHKLTSDTALPSSLSSPSTFPFESIQNARGRFRGVSCVDKPLGQRTRPNEKKGVRRYNPDSHRGGAVDVHVCVAPQFLFSVLSCFPRTTGEKGRHTYQHVLPTQGDPRPSCRRSGSGITEEKERTPGGAACPPVGLAVSYPARVLSHKPASEKAALRRSPHIRRQPNRIARLSRPGVRFSGLSTATAKGLLSSLVLATSWSDDRTTGKPGLLAYEKKRIDLSGREFSTGT